MFSSSEEISRRRFDLRWRHDPFGGGRPYRFKEWINGFLIVYRRFSPLCTSWVKIKQRFCWSQVLYFFFQNNWKPCTRTRMILPLVIDNKKIFRAMGFVDHMTPASSDSTFSKNMPTVLWKVKILRIASLTAVLQLLISVAENSFTAQAYVSVGIQFVNSNCISMVSSGLFNTFRTELADR